MIKVNRVPNAENLSLKLFQIKFLQLSCSNLNSERFLLLGEWKNQQSYSTFWERGSLSHLNRVCVWNLFFIIFFNRKKINKLAVGCTDFLFEILGCCGSKLLPILTKMLIIFCNSSWLPVGCILFVISPGQKWLLIMYHTALKKWAIWFSFLFFFPSREECEGRVRGFSGAAHPLHVWAASLICMGTLGIVVLDLVAWSLL